MKQKILKYVLVCVLTMACFSAIMTSCDEDSAVVVKLNDQAITFTPYAGGAIMHYLLPSDPDIAGVHVRYKDAHGQSILRTGSALSDSLIIIGFDRAQTDVKCNVHLLFNDGSESAAIPYTFSTLDSSPIVFIDNVLVESCWNGFSVTYNNPENTTGMAHIFYLGINPHTQEADTILLESLPLTSGSDTLTYELKQDNGDDNTIVIRVEDYRGYMVGERVWENIHNLKLQQLDPSLLTIHYNNSIEVPDECIGLKYLTDGDSRGAIWWEEQDPFKYYTFISGNNAVGDDSEPMYIDMGQKYITAQIRLCAMLNMGYINKDGEMMSRPDFYCGNSSKYKTTGNTYIYEVYYNRLPCNFTIWGSREAGDVNDYDQLEWEQLGSYEQDDDQTQYDMSQCWFKNCATYQDFDNDDYPVFETLEEVQAVEDDDLPAVAVKFLANGQGDGFRYLKIRFNKVYKLDSTLSASANASNERSQRITLHEVEVYTAK